MKTIEETRRGLFEGKYPMPSWVTWNVDRSDYYSIFRDSTRKRQAEIYSAKWQGFNAALDAVVIELPTDPNHEFSDRASAVDACRSAITSTNLGLTAK